MMNLVTLTIDELNTMSDTILATLPILSCQKSFVCKADDQCITMMLIKSKSMAWLPAITCCSLVNRKSY